MRKLLKFVLLAVAFLLFVWGLTQLFTAHKHSGHSGHCCEEGH